MAKIAASQIKLEVIATGKKQVKAVVGSLHELEVQFKNSVTAAKRLSKSAAVNARRLARLRILSIALYKEKKKLNDARNAGAILAKQEAAASKLLATQRKKAIATENRLKETIKKKLEKEAEALARAKQLDAQTKKSNRILRSQKNTLQGLHAQQKVINKALQRTVIGTKKYNALLKMQTRLQNRVAASGGAAAGAIGRMRIATAGLQRFLGVLRNQLLLVTFATAGIIRLGKSLVTAFKEQEIAEKRVTQTLISTGYAAGLTSKAVYDLSVALQKTTGVSDEVILSGSQLLLTFTNIGRDVFPVAQKAALDMTAGMNAGKITSESLKNTTIQLGKALNSPIKGMNALSRVGVRFTSQQKKQIRAFVNTNQIAKAQAIVLKELNVEFGNQASIDSYQKAIRAMDSATSDLAEKMGAALLPMAKALAKTIKELSETLKPSGIARAFVSLATSIGLVSAGFSTLSIKTALFAAKAKLAKGASLGLAGAMRTVWKASKLLRATGFGLLIAGGAILVGKILNMFGAFNKLDEGIDAHKKKLKELNEQYQALSQDERNRTMASLNFRIKTIEDTQKAMESLVQLAEDAAVKHPEAWNLATKSIKRYNAGAITLEQHMENMAIAQKKVKESAIHLSDALSQDVVKVMSQLMSLVPTTSLTFQDLENIQGTFVNGTTATTETLMLLKGVFEKSGISIENFKGLLKLSKEELEAVSAVFKDDLAEEIAKVTDKYTEQAIELRRVNVLDKELAKAAHAVGLETLTEADGHKALIDAVKDLIKAKQELLDVNLNVKAQLTEMKTAGESQFDIQKKQLEFEKEAAIAKAGTIDNLSDAQHRYFAAMEAAIFKEEELWKKEKAQEYFEFLLSSIDKIVQATKAWVSQDIQMHTERETAKIEKEKERINATVKNERVRTKLLKAQDVKLADLEKQQHNRGINLEMLSLVASTAVAVAKIHSAAAVQAMIAPWASVGIMALAKLNIATTLGASAIALGTLQASKYAKGGEFVTNQPEMIMVGEAGREHVKITPIDRPADRALGSSNVTVNFSGNVLSKDFIEDEAIPQIKEALRRGGDIGLA